MEVEWEEEEAVVVVDIADGNCLFNISISWVSNFNKLKSGKKKKNFNHA